MNQAELKQRVHYDPDSGLFTWLTGKRRGQQAGSLKPNGYIRINFARGLMLAAHRCAWLYMNGVWPSNQIDHINRVRSDNRFCNLRDVSASQNQLNSAAIGVSWVRRKKKWRYELRIMGQRFRGIRATREEAASAYQELKGRLFMANEQASPADRGSQSVPDLDGQSTTDVGEMASRLFSKVSRKQNAPGVVS